MSRPEEWGALLVPPNGGPAAIDLDNELRAHGAWDPVDPHGPVLTRADGALWDPSDDSIYVYGFKGVIKVQSGGRVRFYPTQRHVPVAVLAGPGTLVASFFTQLHSYDFRDGDPVEKVVATVTATPVYGTMGAMTISRDRARIVVLESFAARLHIVHIDPEKPARVGLLFNGEHPDFFTAGLLFTDVKYALDDRTLFVTTQTSVYHFDPVARRLRRLYANARSDRVDATRRKMTLHVDRDGSLLVYEPEVITRLAPMTLPVQRPLPFSVHWNIQRGPAGLLIELVREPRELAAIKLVYGVLASDAELRKTQLRMGGAFVGAFLVACRRFPVPIVTSDQRSMVAAAIAAARFHSEATAALVRTYDPTP